MEPVFDIGRTKGNNITKRKKSAGSDTIYNEHIQDTATTLLPVWTKLVNRCVEQGAIPEKWKFSTIKMLFNGKGDPKDKNKYREYSFRV